jgi:UDP-3-O-[3-hydroxymyristoyl] N-acetylglucosamine deacetylase
VRAPESLQHTLASPTWFEGIGVHSGRLVRAWLRPAPVDTGVVFVRADVAGRDNVVRVAPEAVTATALNTEIVNGDGVTVSTIEHLMAAFAALSIDNVVVELDGPELPIMDGSAAPFVSFIDRAGRRTQESPRRYIEVLRPVEIQQGAKRACLYPLGRPAAVLDLEFEIDFPSRAIGRQSVELTVDEAAFRRELAAARTFGFLHEVQALRERGLALGGGMDNAIVVDGDEVLNPEGLRFEDEFVRHKALDAIGDLYVLGAPVIGRFEGRYAGHAINNVLVRALASQPAAWRERTFIPRLAAAV